MQTEVITLPIRGESVAIMLTRGVLSNGVRLAANRIASFLALGIRSGIDWHVVERTSCEFCPAKGGGCMVCG